MEWGNFWSSHLPRTSYDVDLDCESPNPNDQVALVFFLGIFPDLSIDHAYLYTEFLLCGWMTYENHVVGI